MNSVNRQYLPTRVVCNRYNLCTRTLYRWRDAPKLGFPKGIEINGRRYYGSDELDEWDRARERLANIATAAACSNIASGSDIQQNSNRPEYSGLRPGCSHQSGEIE